MKHKCNFCDRDADRKLIGEIYICNVCYDDLRRDVEFDDYEEGDKDNGNE